MEQRPLRLGDIVDDYCPRERRLTNHAIVVMAGAEISHTRCTTCDAEHPFKKGKVPSRKVRAGDVPAPPAAEPVGVLASEPVPAAVLVAEPPSVPVSEPAAVRVAEPAPVPAGEPVWTHRPLIRASLPRLEGQPPPQPQRQGPEFTIRQLGRRQRDNGPRWQQGNGRSRHSR